MANKLPTEWDGTSIKALSLIGASLSLVGTGYIIISFLLHNTGFYWQQHKYRKLQARAARLSEKYEENARASLKRELVRTQQEMNDFEDELFSSEPPCSEHFMRFYRFVFYLSIAHFFNSIIWILSTSLNGINSGVCSILAPLNIYFLGCVLCWTSFIATEIMYRFSHTTISHFGETIVPETVSGLQERWFHLIGWCLPLIVTAGPVIEGRFGFGLWTCWFEESTGGWMYAYGGLVIMTLTYCGAVYFYVAVFFTKQLERSGILGVNERKESQLLVTRFSAYILVFILCWTPPLLRNFIVMINPSAEGTMLYILTAISAFSLPLNGFLDSILYGGTRQRTMTIISRARDLFTRIICCWRRRHYEEISEGVLSGMELDLREN